MVFYLQSVWYIFVPKNGWGHYPFVVSPFINWDHYTSQKNDIETEKWFKWHTIYTSEITWPEAIIHFHHWSLLPWCSGRPFSMGKSQDGILIFGMKDMCNSLYNSNTTVQLINSRMITKHIRRLLNETGGDNKNWRSTRWQWHVVRGCHVMQEMDGIVWVGWGG